MSKILVTGASGQIGSDLCEALAKKFGAENIIASDIKHSDEAKEYKQIILDVTHEEDFSNVLDTYHISTVYHLASLLSGTSELKPVMAWHLNLDPLLFLLEKAKEGKIQKIFWPSSIAVFGKGLPKKMVGQDVALNPTTMYGITKVSGELLCQYYIEKHGVDVRSLRYPGLISWKTEPGGGTTDYAVEIFYKALQEGRYTSFLKEDSALPMMYMEDAITATIRLMEAKSEDLSVHTSYNIGGISFSPKEITSEIQKHLPDFKVAYEPDFRQEIADSWPDSIDDQVAKKDWGLQYQYDLPELTKEMLDKLKIKFHQS